MKKIIFVTAFIIMAGIAYGQTLQKGNFIGFHYYTITLDPDATLNQFLDVWQNKVVPAWEKNFQVKVYILKGIRGECKNCFAVIVIYESEADRNKFFNKDDTFNEMGQAASDKCQPALDELGKLGELTRKYTDWIVQ